jgi:MerR-like DNA binding protein
MTSDVPLLSIGEFSRMTFLSVKTLRHYHDTGLLAPARIDPSSGYRYYDVSQVTTAQVIGASATSTCRSSSCARSWTPPTRKGGTR